ncbi:MAG: ATP-binding cassette domain-containing protein [Coriobacteriales bacterium]
MTQELLRLHDAKVKMDGRVILDVDDFVINQGEHIVVLGPNGSGKSTLVKLLTKEIEPVWRETPPVLFMGQSDPSEETLIETVGLVSTDVQERMMVHRTVFDIVLGGFFGSVGVPFHIGASDEQVEQARKAIREIGIPSLSERDMLTLSTGQARRALIARALINGPALLIFDEPTSGLDPEGAWNMRQSLSALAKAGHTILVITHNVSDIMPEFERVVMLQDAHIVADGPKEEVLTTQKLRHLFGVPITLVETDGRYHLQ